MTRTLTLRVPDAQYDWLIERAVDGFDGELSEAVRDAIDAARVFYDLLDSEDRVAAFAEFIRRSKEEQEADELAEIRAEQEAADELEREIKADHED